MSDKPNKRFDKLSYGAIALYFLLMAVLALGVYGINTTSTILDKNRSERARAQVQTGRMVVITEDRTQCRSMRFDNETAELGRETLVECDARLLQDSGASFGAIRDGFSKR